LNPEKKLVCVIFKNSVRTSKRTQQFTITENLINAVKDIIVVYNENYTELINTNEVLQIVKIAGAYDYDCASKG
jgi:hypothetical protein